MHYINVQELFGIYCAWRVEVYVYYEAINHMRKTQKGLR